MSESVHLIKRFKLWRRRCSTCHQRMTTPGCSTRPVAPGEPRPSFHTIAGPGPCVNRKETAGER